jgi:hypothetical protein
MTFPFCSAWGERLDRNFQLTIAAVETLRIERQQEGRTIFNHDLSATANLFLQTAATNNA